MPSESYPVLLEGLDEVSLLLGADPTPKGKISQDPGLTRAVTRACVVILCSHYERYLRSINEEAVLLLNNEVDFDADLLTEKFRLRHSKISIDELSTTKWDNRSNGLQMFSRKEAWLWSEADKGILDFKRIIQWIKSPKPFEVIRYYELWGINDIFTSITRTPHTRGHLFRKLTELVEKRNNIAHGDFSTEATPNDIREYQNNVKNFCTRADRYLARKLRNSLGVNCTWY
jgi:hypothetical protein